MSASAIYRQLKSGASIINGQVSESTICRFINQLQLELRQMPNRDMHRYEHPHINEVWSGDSSVNPRLMDNDGKKHQAYIIALLDDACRFIVGIDVFYNDNFINFVSVMKFAVSKYGRSKVLNFDNGKSYKNRQMELLAARIGTTLSYCQPYIPIGKIKIERWFRTMKEQQMDELDMQDFHFLDGLCGNIHSYVQKYNQTPHSIFISYRFYYKAIAFCSPLASYSLFRHSAKLKSVVPNLQVFVALTISSSINKSFAY